MANAQFFCLKTHKTIDKIKVCVIIVNVLIIFERSLKWNKIISRYISPQC